jgi:tetratricopeptide (TPR) repeat protein
VRRSVEKPEIVRNTGAPRVGRRPGESAEAWRSRGAALQMRYGYSKAALDRGDFSAAAGGFEAILIEEPGYLDAPGLLVQAQQGLRASARSLFQAGNRLDAAGDWVGALQKYEQARQIYAGIPGLSDALKRVRVKLQVAGSTAFNQAKQLEAQGRPQEALKEYEKAMQWLPQDDPNRQIARTRIEQLRRND